MWVYEQIEFQPDMTTIKLLKYWISKILTSEWGESVLFIVDVMGSMEIFVKWFYVMQLSVHPIDTKLYNNHINR